jgi:tripartite-type tricarboxylate transporter receptor subunit TctC
MTSVKLGRRKLLRLAAASGLAASLPRVSVAYPDRPIRLIVAFVPGGATDTLARQISEDLKAALGQPVIIENRPGANGYIAWNYVAGSDPDGYTFLLAENALAISQALYKKASSSFDPLTQYDAVAGVATSGSALVVSPTVPANTVAELIALSRTVPQKMNFASAGIGSVSHLNFEVFKRSMGMEAIHIPYKGGGQAIGDVVAGHVPMTITSIQAIKGLVETGRLRALGVTSLERSPALPDAPTMYEIGMKPPGVELRFWFGIFGPKGLPPPVVARMEQAVEAVTADPDVRHRLAKLDITAEFLKAPALSTRLRDEVQNWTKFIDETGIKAE